MTSKTSAKCSNSVRVTVENNMCIDCGVCDVSCPHDAINMIFTDTLNYRPDVLEEKCTNCGICLAVCPMSEKNLSLRVAEAGRDKLYFGLNKSKAVLKGYETNYKTYIESASGGILSSLIKYLISHKIIDAVVHAEQLFGDQNTPYFQSSISKSIDEIEQKRSSFYHPINFSPTLKKIIEDDTIQSVAVLGTPCVLSAVKNLRKYHKAFNKKVKFSLSLVCSHNVSGQFTDYMATTMSKSSEKKQFKHRDKVGIQKDSEFNNLVVVKDKIIRQNRNLTPFTKNWRSFSYAHEGCLYCPDFFGHDADAGFKDAWGYSVQQKEGETVFFVNNTELLDAIKAMKQEGIIHYTESSKEELIKSQKSTLISKTYFTQLRKNNYQIKNTRKPKSTQTKESKIKYTLLEKALIKIEHFIKKKNLRKSKQVYQKTGKPLSNQRLKWSAFMLRKIGVYLSLLSLSRENEPNFEILYTAGFGYDNIGDEAQLSSNLELWQQFYPEAKLTILSPNPDYTRRVHGNYDIIKSGRKTFWGIHNVEYGGLSARPLFKWFFRYRFMLIKIASFTLKYFNRTVFISPQSAYLLKRIQKAHLLHIGGGGYLTGKTQSRLFDNMGLIWVANYFGLDVILSGHNIGIWQNNYQKRISKQLKKAIYIGLRDNKNSIDDLKEIGIDDSKKVYPLFDDALFCSGIPKNELKTAFEKNRLDFDKEYILVNCYFFKDTKQEVQESIEQLAKLINKNIDTKSFNIVLLSMHQSDNEALEYFKNKAPFETTIFNHQNNFKTVISLIRNSKMMISMRHHPLIFAMSGHVPSLSIVFDDYFKHKNIGAMELFNQEKYVCLNKELFDGSFEEKLSYILTHRAIISDEIAKEANLFLKKRGQVMKLYLKKYLKIEI